MSGRRKQRRRKGPVVVEVVRAKGLRAADKGGASDCYAVLKVGKEKHKTKVKKKTVERVWEEELVFWGGPALTLPLTLPSSQASVGGGVRLWGRQA